MNVADGVVLIGPIGPSGRDGCTDLTYEGIDDGECDDE
jgi:hypothetical protein